MDKHLKHLNTIAREVVKEKVYVEYYTYKNKVRAFSGVVFSVFSGQVGWSR